MKLLIFSSPLHYLVALLVKESSGSDCVGLYLEHKKDCTAVFEKISAKLKVDLCYVKDVAELTKNSQIEEVVLSNRFDATQIQLATRLRKQVKLCFMEEGASIYLEESHIAKGMRDDNVVLRVCELLRVQLGRPRRFIPMNWFSSGYSFCAAEIPWLSKSCEVINLTPNLFSCIDTDISESRGSVRRALILSQWFAAKNIVSETEMLEFYGKLYETKLRSYQTVYYKPHPWDSDDFTSLVKERYGFKTVDDEDLPVELWLASNQDVDLYGFWTSTMIYCGGVLPNKAYSALKALSNYVSNDNINHQYRVAHKLLRLSGVEELDDV